MTEATTRPARRRRTRHHGTEAEYRRGCRCEPCKTAATEARKARADRRTLERNLEQAHRELAALQKIPAVAGLTVAVEPEVFDRYVEARREHERTAAALALAELELKRLIGSASVVRCRGRLVATWAMHTRTFFDGASFREAHGALWSKFQRQGEVRQFRPVAFAATPPARAARATAKGKRR